ncbi:MAG: DUF3332 domain-containing protein [Muribaculaceae bacterium]|nr:DUF3332 domain-containing protein [Muribaculaceae bacterium]
MKHRIVTSLMAALMLLTAITTPSCLGSFALTNRMLGWNRNIDNKFINELVFFAFWVLPVYEVCGLADLLVLNSIEFWGGSNPMKLAKGEKIVEGSDGRYLVRSDASGYDVISLNDGSSVRLDFDAELQEWSFTAADGERHLLFAFVDAGHISVPAPDGKRLTVEISDQGVYAYRRAVGEALMAAR